MSYNYFKYTMEFENNIKILIADFKSSHSDFFFTEKELHAYFYHLCLKSNIFILNNGFNLIHSEYPTPFKCKKLPAYPFIDTAKSDEKQVRAHIDIVLLNPNFVEFVYNANLQEGIKYITGLTNGLFSDYISRFYLVYSEFQKYCPEPILLYALEFKYLRHTISGTKLPIQEITYDIEKLNLLSKFVADGCKLNFCLNTRSIVFFGNRSLHLQSQIVSQLPPGASNYQVIP